MRRLGGHDSIQIDSEKCGQNSLLNESTNNDMCDFANLRIRLSTLNFSNYPKACGSERHEEENENHSEYENAHGKKNIIFKSSVDCKVRSRAVGSSGRKTFLKRSAAQRC